MSTCCAVNESQFRTRDKSGVFVKSWLSTSVEWENETRKVDLKQTWPEGLVSWPRLNLLCFVPNARPIIWNLGFHSCRSLETIYRLILVIDHFYSSQTVFNNSLIIVVCLCLSLMRAVDCSGWVGDPAPTRQVGWIAAVLARWQGEGGDGEGKERSMSIGKQTKYQKLEFDWNILSVLVCWWYRYASISVFCQRWFMFIKWPHAGWLALVMMDEKGRK